MSEIVQISRYDIHKAMIKLCEQDKLTHRIINDRPILIPFLMHVSEQLEQIWFGEKEDE